MRKKRIFYQFIFNVLFCILSGLGLVFVISPIFLYWWIHGNYERYLWIINGPAPYNKFGSGPYQFFLFSGLFLLGILFFVCALMLRKKVINELPCSKLTGYHKDIIRNKPQGINPLKIIK